MIDLFPFAGYPVAVYGLGPEGLAAARALMSSEAEVLAWDAAPDRRAIAEAEGVSLRNLEDIDWREPVSLVIEHDIAHGETGADPIIVAAREADCEVISDVELLARAQRDAAYGAVVSRRLGPAAVSFIGEVLSVTGRETEFGGDAEHPALGLHPMDLGGAYILDMPPSKADMTVSITFDVALFLDIGAEGWAPCRTHAETEAASRWVFHRQTGPKGAVVNVDDRDGKRIFEALKAADEQIVIPISGRSRCAGGVYAAGGVLFDDINGANLTITELPLSGGEDDGTRSLLSAATFAVTTILDVPQHAAMAAIRGYLGGGELD